MHVGSVACEVILTGTGKHHVAIVHAGRSQASNWFPHDETATLRSITKPMMTPSESVFITLRCVPLNALLSGSTEPFRIRAKRTCVNQPHRIFCYVDVELYSGDEPMDVVISDGAPFSVLDLKHPTTKLPHVVNQDEREFVRLPMRL